MKHSSRSAGKNFMLAHALAVLEALKDTAKEYTQAEIEKRIKDKKRRRAKNKVARKSRRRNMHIMKRR